MRQAEADAHAGGGGVTLTGFLRLQVALLAGEAGVGEDVELRAHGFGETERERQRVA